MTTGMPTNLDRYQRIAPLYDFLDLPFEYVLYRRIRRLLFQNLSDRLLDAGVGTGRNIPFYPPGSHVVGIDFSPAMLSCARRKADRSSAWIELKEMNIASLDLPDSTFDAAVASFLFCVLPDALQVPALRELGRVVKPGGMIRLINYVRPLGFVRGPSQSYGNHVLLEPLAQVSIAKQRKRFQRQTCCLWNLDMSCMISSNSSPLVLRSSGSVDPQMALPIALAPRSN